MDKSKRILQLGLSENLGGIETYLLKITEHLDKTKYSFDFLVFNESEPCFKKELERFGCGFHSITSRRSNYFKYIKELGSVICNGNYDIIHCNFNSLSNFEPALIGLKYKKKVIVHSHNASIISSIKSRILNILGYIVMYNMPIERVAVSDLAGKWMFGKKKEFTVLNNGIDVEKFQYNEQWRNEIRKEFNIDDNELIFHAGAFRPQKNHKKLIEIFKLYHEMHPDAILMLAGEGELKKDIENTVNNCGLSENVIFTGLRNDVPKLMSAADKFILPSFYEGFPNVLIEAETSGLYCVVSDSITKQAMLGELCQSVSLDSSDKEWTRILSKTNQIERSNSAKIIKSANLDIDSEMRRLYKIYNK